MSDVEVVHCGGCGMLLGDGAWVVVPRVPCPECGATIRHVKMLEQSVVGVGIVTSEVRGKNPSKHKGWFYKETRKQELFRDEGVMAWVHRTFDRVQDRYRERVTRVNDSSVVREVDEPLSAHQGRGSARAKRGILPISSSAAPGAEDGAPAPPAGEQAGEAGP